MRKKVLLFCMVVLVNLLSAQNQINNSGFEQWEGEGKSLKPVGWNTMNTADGSYSWVVDKGQVERSTDVRIGSSGKSSARIYSSSVLGVVVNGNLTTGRVHMGSMKAASADNNNSTRTKEKGFHHLFSGMPDSMTIWVKNDCIDKTQNAYIHAIIHDEFDYSEPATKLCEGHLVGDVLIISKNTNGAWVRKSVPFKYYNKNLTGQKYILVAIGTNQIAGKGDKKDAMLLDDILMIYNPKISLKALPKTVFTKDETIEIAFSLTGTMSPENLNAPKNVVTAQLSDSNGNFDNPIILGKIVTDKSGVIYGKIPKETIAGKGYRVRLTTTNYPMISNDNGVDITIK